MVDETLVPEGATSIPVFEPVEDPTPVPPPDPEDPVAEPVAEEPAPSPGPPPLESVIASTPEPVGPLADTQTHLEKAVSLLETIRHRGGPYDDVLTREIDTFLAQGVRVE